MLTISPKKRESLPMKPETILKPRRWIRQSRALFLSSGKATKNPGNRNMARQSPLLPKEATTIRKLQKRGFRSAI